MKNFNFPYFLTLVFSLFFASTTQAAVPLLTSITSIAAGDFYTCAVTTTGGVKCWGRNTSGQLGDNTTTNRLTPVDVLGLGSGVSGIALGGNYTCALTTAGGVKCWGDNHFGELGDNQASGNQSNVPVDVVGLSSGVNAIATGSSHTCAVTTVGSVKCWGYNGNGQLGDNTTTYRLTPVGVVGLSSGVSAITGGFSHTCAMMTAGGVKCWGYNDYGQLADDTFWDRHTPVAVVGLSSGVSAITGGGWHTCALMTAGSVKCWGDNEYGEIGNNSSRYLNALSPVDVIAFIPTKHDYDGGGKADVLFLNTTTGAIQYWKAATRSNKVYPGRYDNVNYNYVGNGDFDGDGQADLLFVNPSNNDTMIWSGAVKSAASYPGTGTAGFNVAAICDIYGNGKDDIVWYNATTGQTQIWPAATKASVTYPGTQDTGFSIVACADFDGDRQADLFWHNTVTGANQVWFSVNQYNSEDRATSPDLTLTVVGAADGDLIWYKPSTGAIVVWKNGEMRDGGHGQNATSTWVYLGTKDTSFTPKAIGDYDGDGKADLLWSNDTTGATEIWYGMMKANARFPGVVPSGFSIQK